MLDKLNRRNCDITVVGNMACQALTSVSTSVSSHNMVDNASVLWEILKGRKLPGLMALDRVGLLKDPHVSVNHISWSLDGSLFSKFEDEKNPRQSYQEVSCEEHS
ncbi:hypothetical protein LOK49_LG05G01441 [Camellia lanceoleosa]|uniref:Uncharacterized protein n=1 Tax=Camellia lanceoleosa TaxID=1840588 RepID=A0ACC0HLN9_9ERIC|nr:hypothetical protein LOK49_LG05G01441 [Camellia lanceoleosa]